MKHSVLLSATIISIIVVAYATGYVAFDTYVLEHPDQKFGAKGGVQFAFMIGIVGATIFSFCTSVVFYLLWRTNPPNKRGVLCISTLTGTILAMLLIHIVSNTPYFLFKLFGDFAIVVYAVFIAVSVAVLSNSIGNRFFHFSGQNT